MIGSFMPGAGAHIFSNGGKHCIFCDATKPGYDCEGEPAIETLMYQALSAAANRPCGRQACAEEYPGMPSRWCHGCVIAALCGRIGWQVQLTGGGSQQPSRDAVDPAGTRGQEGPTRVSSCSCSSLVADLASALKGYGQHKGTCELSRPYKRVVYWGRGLWKVWEQQHVCGLSGYNPMIDPPCPACEEKPVPRELRCTCGLSALLARVSEGQ